MKILLINPCWDYQPVKKGPVYNRKFPPVELANIAGYLLENNIEPVIYDANIENISPEEVAGKAAGFDKIFITSSTLDKWICPNIDIDVFLQTTKLIRQVQEQMYILGAHPTVHPEKILRQTGARAAIIGEPELTAKELALHDDRSHIKGIAYIDEHDVFCRNEPQTPIDLNSMPMPAFHLLKKSAYFYEVLGDDMMVLEGSRGCPYPCIFCFKSMYGDSVRKKEPAKLIKEVESVIKSNGVRSVYFMDLEFTVFKKNVIELSDLLIERGSPVEWCCQTRADAVDENLLEKMKKAGCTLIHFGVETGSERIMKLIHKNITKEKILKGMQLTKEAGIDTACFFMFGFPAETKEEMQETVDFARQLNPIYASFHVAIPYPETAFYDNFKSVPDSLFPSHFSDEFTFQELSSISRKAFLSYYLRFTYIFDRLRNANLRSLWKQFKIFLWYIK
ncbi:MAG: hypothetical protein A2Y62_18590 [Candidatus Fischerbacteria bacterium RBG_13_37_8]|uniref:Radical SAM core domain-containing protein n=1 Tax=Candidatus Fischerbacteria bacterium RBG_13_37_8 TaxID=1817863 RepID=A0A1F5V5X3_9BACT|nr:MAG: hypothetical protein A2Y62_18590 [Candidatus Fischerbacteria bacterium RBG_13_37_8]